jgi:arabinogalactan oligomer/maltooligosaccharide transport system permease protein
MKGPWTIRRRILIGLALALLVGVGLQYWTFIRSRINERRTQHERLGIVMLESFSEVVGKSSESGDALRRAVTKIAQENPSVRVIRVIKGTSLQASTSPEDRGDKAAPRRLMRDEKPLYDQGQRLRAAVLTNQEEGASRKEEIEISRDSAGRVLLTGPIEEDGTVTGLVQIQSRPFSPPPTPRWYKPLLLIAAALILFFVLSLWIGERLFPLAVVASALLLLIVGGYGWYVQKNLVNGRIQIEKSVAQRIIEQRDRAMTTLQALSVELSSPLKPSSWDVDVFQHPRGFINDAGQINQQKLQADISGGVSSLRKFLALILTISLGILAFFGLGYASRLYNTVRLYRQAYLYTLPAMAGMLLLVFFPFIYGIALSFTDSNLYNTNKSITETWIGIKNYAEVLGDFNVIKHAQNGWLINYQNFYWTLLFTIIWTVTNVAFGVTFGLILALILNTKGLAMRPLYRVLLIFPWAMPNYITALIWKGMFHQQFGVINQVIQMFGGSAISWFQKPLTSFITVLSTNGWLSFPFMMVVSLGALQSIPGDLYEAARVDGASKWQQFRSITLPSLKPALIPAIILSVVWTFNMFNIIYLVSQGEPGGSTEILITEAYKIAFEKYRYGYAAAYSTVIFLILLVYGSIQNRVTRATEAITE